MKVIIPTFTDFVIWVFIIPTVIGVIVAWLVVQTNAAMRKKW